jgi:hypothetical protein
MSLLSIIFVLVSTLVGVSGAQATGPDASTPSPAAATDESTLAAVFPEGLPVGAVMIDTDSIALDGGAVILNLGPTALSDCPSNWVCLWHDSQFSGRMLQFQECCQWQNLSDYGFDDQMSSWANKRDFDARWAYLPNGGGTVRCMDSHSNNSWVGNTDNDKASSIRILDTDGAC